MTFRYISLPLSFSLHPFHYTTFHYNSISLRYISLQDVCTHIAVTKYNECTNCYISLHCISLHRISLHFITFRYISLPLSFSLHIFRDITFWSQMHLVTLHFATGLMNIDRREKKTLKNQQKNQSSM